MAYDDDDDYYKSWEDFLDFKWRDFLDWARLYKVDRDKITLGQLSRLLDNLAKITEQYGGSFERINIAQIEEILKNENLENVSLKTVITIAELHNDYSQSTESKNNLISSIPLTRLDSLISKQLGRIEISDVVALASFSKLNQSKGTNVLENVTIGELNKSLTNSALNFLIIKDLRKVVEQLSNLYH